MRETLVIRLNDHVVENGVQQFTMEWSVPGRYQKIHVGASQADLALLSLESLGQIFTLLGIPQQTVVPEPVVEAPDAEQAPRGPVGFRSEGTAKFTAQVIRNGVVVDD